MVLLAVNGLENLCYNIDDFFLLKSIFSNKLCFFKVNTLRNAFVLFFKSCLLRKHQTMHKETFLKKQNSD